MNYKLFIFILLIYSPLISQDSPEKIKENFAWQIALEAKMYSTGLLDGIWGQKSANTLKEFLLAEGLGDIANPKSSEQVKTLLQVDLVNVFTEYEITEMDAQQLVVIPEDWNERAKLPNMGYEALFEVVQGKFRCSKKALNRLNPTIPTESYKVGTKLVVPLVKAPLKRSITRLEIHLNDKTISGFDSNNKKIMFIYCSVAQSKEKFPGKNGVVANKAVNPNYTFNPKYWPEVNNVTQVLIIKPGPKNPVGLAWIGLDLPGYGIHGTPTPDNIGKTGSHGCFRLTNWHAIHLLGCIDIGTPVIMIGNTQEVEIPKEKETLPPLDTEEVKEIKETKETNEDPLKLPEKK